MLGACTDPAGPVLLIMEFAEFGSLRGFLHRCRASVELVCSPGEYQVYRT